MLQHSKYLGVSNNITLANCSPLYTSSCQHHLFKTRSHFKVKPNLFYNWKM